MISKSKKKVFRVIAAVLAAGLLLTGCGSQGNDTQEAPTEEQVSYESIMATFKPNFNDEQAMKMNNFVYCGMAYIEDHTYYGRFGVKGKDPWQFVKMELVADPENENYLTSGDWSIIADDVVPQYINKVGDTIYYVAQDWTKDPENPEYSINKVSAAGGDATKLADGNGYLTVKGDKMYFTNLENKFVVTDLEGKNEEVILDKEVYYPYLVDDNWIIYQDDADNESLHIYSMSDKLDFKLNDEPSYNPVIFENFVYFTVHASENESAYNIARIDLAGYKVNGKDVTFTMEKGENLMGSNFKIDYNEEFGFEQISGMNGASGHDIAKWTDCKDDAYDKLTEEYLFLSKDIDAYIKYNDEGQTAKCFMNKATGYGQSISSLE